MLKHVLLLLLILSIVIPNVSAAEPKNFAYKILPEKLVENTEGILQIYAMSENTPISYKINDLIVTSSDSNIIQITEIKQTNDFITTVKLKAIESGTANIALAAPGFSSEEFTTKVFDIKQGEQQILLKAVPDTFTINGPNKGHFSVELADVDGNPIIAKQDTNISISTSNSDIIKLPKTALTIKSGDYFTVGEFEIIDTGEASLYANNNQINSAESTITVIENNDNDLIIKLHVIPNKISNFASSKAYAIVQLQNSEGEPVRATEDIPVTLKIHHANSKENRSPDVNALDPLIIPKGSMNAFTEISVLAGLEETYEINISAENYLVSEPQHLETTFSGSISDLHTTLETIPISLTGSKEIIGVIYPINDEGIAMVNTKKLENKIDSSNEEVISISDITISKGEGPKIVMGDVGLTGLNDIKLMLLGEEREVVNPVIYGPSEAELTLNVEPIISKVLPKTAFPLILYMTDTSGANWYFPKTSPIFMSPNSFLKTPLLTVSEGESSTILPTIAIKDGKDVIKFGINGQTSSLNWESMPTIPAQVELTHTKHLLSGIKNTVSLQIVDTNGSPMFANRNIEFRLTSNNENIELPKTVVIKKGTYNTFFDILPNESQDSEISILASDFPLSKFQLNTANTKQELIISTVNSIEPNEEFDLVLDAKIGNAPIPDLEIIWDVQGASIKDVVSTTNVDGKIKLTLVADDANLIKIKATTDDQGISASKEIIVNGITSEGISPKENNELALNENLGLIIAPGVAIGGGILIRRKNLMAPIMEKIPFIERIIEPINEILEKLEIQERILVIKEKIPVIRDR